MGCRLAAINHNTLALEPLSSVLCVLRRLRSSRRRRRRRRKQSLFYVPDRAATLIRANGRQSAPKSTGVFANVAKTGWNARVYFCTHSRRIHAAARGAKMPKETFFLSSRSLSFFAPGFYVNDFYGTWKFLNVAIWG